MWKVESEVKDSAKRQRTQGFSAGLRGIARFGIILVLGGVPLFVFADVPTGQQPDAGLSVLTSLGLGSLALLTLRRVRQALRAAHD